MKRIIVAVFVLALLSGCCCFEDLEEGNKLAVENHKNLEANTIRIFDNFKVLGQKTGKWDNEDEKKWQAQKNEAAKQLLINKAWLLVIKEAIEREAVNSNMLEDVIEKLPGWIEDGKDLYDQIKELFDKGE